MNRINLIDTGGYRVDVEVAPIEALPGHTAVHFTSVYAHAAQPEQRTLLRLVLDDAGMDRLALATRLGADLSLAVECFVLDHRNGLGPDPERLAVLIENTQRR